MTTLNPDFVYLVDNGSLRPEATYQLRELARRLEAQLSIPVRPVSLLHSHKIEAERLDGEPATILKRQLLADGRAGASSVVVLPLFLGPSRAVTDYMPEVIAECQAKLPHLQVAIASVLAGDSVDDPDARLVDILEAHARAAVTEAGVPNCSVTLVDHGTPMEVVNRLRNVLAAQLEQRLADWALPVVASSMERRDGSEYDFNEPLLERIDSVAASGSKDRLCVVMCFLLPGRHAGEGGDVHSIVGELVSRGAYRDASISPLIAEHELLLQILKDRFAAVLENRS
ncbi:sirohydrochlorin chelatase [Coraliomargarita akajimensis]|uniref:Cobalamin (Vitamin B12) biosynthesis CbiX protein n=1 Tax=Coraliomargarita akajimensis (strain DSM 45221 / IAM 15411 / JCM 23193 / KCTC 12865 / 04OKA010-24) TaxID=583355 RepID=D5EJ74_CORAD|nr:CbiX/SirB N-terminal domain-containing protein [Coraliomargarita akajimensis]ADE54473.1 cobalamin (vitamin B12) biosynthesis CbiX protein [Coraliomargarita akajimensis DSM 45221]